MYTKILVIAVLFIGTGIVLASGKRPALKEGEIKTGAISGTVIERHAKGICKGAQVVLLPRRGPYHDSLIVASTSLDSLGKFAFDKLNPGMYNVVVSCSKGEGDGVVDVRVACDSASIVTLIVEPDEQTMIPEKLPKYWDGKVVPIKENKSDSGRKK